MADALKKKGGMRKGYREVLMRRLNEADAILKASGKIDPVKIGQLKLTITEKHLALKRLDEEIAELIDDEEAVLREITEADEFSERIYESLARINIFVSGTGCSSDGVGPSSGTLSKAKLPKLDLPVFKGDITEWTTFWDMYESAVHSNSNLSSVQKFTYLRTLLSHSAKDAIAGLTLSDANYDEAVKILQERFGNKEKIIAKHMEELVNLDSFVF